MNAIDLTEQYRLLSLWRLEENRQWKLVELARPANAIYRCRHDPEKTLFAFLPDFCPANIHLGNHLEHQISQKPRQAASQYS